MSAVNTQQSASLLLDKHAAGSVPPAGSVLYQSAQLTQRIDGHSELPECTGRLVTGPPWPDRTPIQADRPHEGVWVHI